LTTEQQETLNEIFLGKEDPDSAFKKPMTNSLKEEIDKIIDNPVETECGACGGSGSYKMSVSTSSTDDSELGYVQQCLVCKGSGRTGYSPELTKKAILTLINQKEKESEIKALKWADRQSRDAVDYSDFLGAMSDRIKELGGDDA